MRASTSSLISASRSLLASSRRSRASEVGLAAAALLPPLPLYRRILRSHNSLPLEMKSLGDAYVKDEFRKHREVENPLQIVGFLTQWKVYLDGLEKQMGLAYRGQQLDVQQFEKLSDEQLYQLHELMGVTKEIYDPTKAQAQPPGGQSEVHAAVEDALDRAKKSNDSG
ncbi:hypothetical protein CBS101457_005736 [Exobasidium rhododendri]|nr:hypothetical protein CBS101457_005736 [Exobasidium rhododendri]